MSHLFFLLLFFESLWGMEKESLDPEFYGCDTFPGHYLLRNGLGDNSFYIWREGKIPYDIDPTFNVTNRQNIEESIRNFNELFQGCLHWYPRTDEYAYVYFSNSGTCYSYIGRVFWPFPLSQSIYLGKCAHLVGHIKHEMIHTLGFYHEHSRSDRDMYVDIRWDNIREENQNQFTTYRWTTGYGEKYDYMSIMHYPAYAFSKNRKDKNMWTIVPKNSTLTQKVGREGGAIDPMTLGRKQNLSEIDVIKIKKMYKCEPYENWKNDCSENGNCGAQEFCDSYIINGQCRTKLADGSFCYDSGQCVNQCSSGVCSRCYSDDHCEKGNYCSYKYVPLIKNECANYCGSYCMFSSQCGGECSTCSWYFTCSK